MNKSKTKKTSECSHCETRKHIRRVGEIVNLMVSELLCRVTKHDASKTEEPEAPILEKQTEKLHSLTYLSDEYKKQQDSVDMKPFFDHHWAKNRHHPQYFPEGVNDMTLVDLVEMISDWKAASERHDNGNILQSIQKNMKRFKITPQLAQILKNTVVALGLVEEIK